MLGQVIHTLPVVEISQTHLFCRQKPRNRSHETVVKSHGRESQTIDCSINGGKQRKLVTCQTGSGGRQYNGYCF